MIAEFNVDVEKFSKPATRGEVAEVAIGALLALQEVTAALVAIVEGEPAIPHIKALQDASAELTGIVRELVAEGRE